MGRFSDIRSVLVGAALLLGCVPGCVASKPPVAPLVQHPAVPQPVALTVYVDDAFPPGERNLLEAAAVSLNIQTHGLVRVTLVSGMTPELFWVPPGSWRLLRILDADGLTQRFDLRNARGVPDPIVGICIRAAHDLYIVPDRTRTSAQMLSVTMHEMLHAVGLEHTVAAPRSVMSPTLPPAAPVTLSVYDLEELRRALVQAPAQTTPDP